MHDDRPTHTALPPPQRERRVTANGGAAADARAPTEGVACLPSQAPQRVTAVAFAPFARPSRTGPGPARGDNTP
ncbi:hypothetical protein [Streptomyces marianii]|uniref:Uncharacterized protein n=1 Tax=Streptomyces marianii TaxID=1817406 RepID=A0A5R9DWE8_9ACTN|nr:hypothetical protein [Streptomyces marianii]TLQ39182.1 hypothetical protein FEF34_37915 [Streptomyces marianii]